MSKKNDYLHPSLLDKWKNKNKYFIWVVCDNCGLENRAAVPKGQKIDVDTIINCDNCGCEIELTEYKTQWIK